MPQQNFFANRFRDNSGLDPLARKVKHALERALLNFQLATEVEFASKITGLFNQIDLYNLDKKDMMRLNIFREEIESQKDIHGLYAVAQKLLDSADPVLRFSIAVELSEVLLKNPSPIMLNNKSLKQLRMMANEDKGLLVEEVSAKVGQSKTLKNQ